MPGVTNPTPEPDAVDAAHPSAPRERLTSRLLVLALAGTLVAVFSPIVGHELLHYDDQSHIVENPLVGEPTVGRLLAVWTRPHLAVYAPLTHTLWAAAAATTRLVAEPDGEPDQWYPVAFHGLNLLLHLASMLVVCRWLGNWSGSNWAGAAGAALFAFHPSVVESVAWASETKGLLSGLLALLCLEQYQRAWGPAGTLARALPVADPSRVRLLMAALAYLACLLAKPSAVAVLPMIALWHALWLGTHWRALATWLGLLTCPTLAVMLVTGDEQSGAYAAGLVTPLERPLVALDAWGFYLRQLVWPAKLGPDYGRAPQMVVDVAHAVAALATLAVAALAARGLAGWRLGSLALGWLLLATLPTSGLVPFFFQEFSTVADRYLVLGLCGPALLLASWVAAPGPRRLRAAVALALVVVCALLSRRQVACWRDDSTLGHCALAVNAHSTLGPTLLSEVARRAERFGEECDWLRQAAEVEPTRPVALYNLAMAYARQRQWNLAEAQLRRAIRVFPGYRSARRQLAEVLLAARAADAAGTQEAFSRRLITDRQRAARREAPAHDVRLDEAISIFTKLAAEKPAAAHDFERLIEIYAEQGQVQDAARVTRQALERYPASRRFRMFRAVLDQQLKSTATPP